MGINSGIFGKVCLNHLADPNNLCHDDFTHFFHPNPVKCIWCIMQHPVYWEHKSYAPAQELNEAKDYIYSDEKPRDWWWS